MAENPTDDVAVVFNGFLALSMKEKGQLVEIMNEFFDNLDRREALRTENEKAVADLIFGTADLSCKCCRR